MASARCEHSQARGSGHWFGVRTGLDSTRGGSWLWQLSFWAPVDRGRNSNPPSSTRALMSSYQPSVEATSTASIRSSAPRNAAIARRDVARDAKGTISVTMGRFATALSGVTPNRVARRAWILVPTGLIAPKTPAMKVHTPAFTTPWTRSVRLAIAAISSVVAYNICSFMIARASSSSNLRVSS